MASPKSPATESVVIFTPLITGRRTVSVVINSSILDFRNLSIPTSLRMAWETQAKIFFAPLRFAQRVHVPHAFARRWVVDPADQAIEKTPGIVEEPFEELLHDLASYMLVLASIKR